MILVPYSAVEEMGVEYRYTCYNHLWHKMVVIEIFASLYLDFIHIV